MRKRVLLALVLIFALLVSSSCSLIIKDEEVDKQTVIIEVAGKTFNKGDVQAMTEQVVSYNEYMASMYAGYGYGYDRNDPETIAAAQSEAIDNLIQNAVIDQKIVEYGFDSFTDEEIAQMETEAADDYKLYYESIQNFMFGDTELTGDELDAAIKAEMVALGYPDEAGLLEEKKLTLSTTKLQDEVVKDVTVTEDELTAEYASRVEAAKENYTTNPSYYGIDVSNGSTAYYAPAGYRYVKHILVKFTDEEQAAIDELDDQLFEKKAANDESLAEEIAALEKQIEEKTEAAYATIQPTVDEVLAKIAAGEAFDSLIEAYNQDPGMTADSEGYLVSAQSTNWVKAFTDASMALANIGDVSEPVRSDYGVHIIKYVSDLAEGEIGLDNVREALSEEMLNAERSEVVTATLEKWIADANAKIYEDRMN